MQPYTVSKRKDCFLARVNGKMRVVLFSDVDFIVAHGNYTEIVAWDRKLMLRTTLKAIEEILPGDLFLRIHRSYIIRISAVTAFDHAHVYLDNTKLLLAPQHYGELLERFTVVCPEQDIRVKEEYDVLYVEEYLGKKRKRKTG